MKKETLEKAKALESAIEKKKQAIVFLKRAGSITISSELEQPYKNNPGHITTFSSRIEVEFCPRRKGSGAEDKVEEISLGQAMKETEDDLSREFVALFHNQINKAERELQQLESEFDQLQDACE